MFLLSVGATALINSNIREILIQIIGGFRMKKIIIAVIVIATISVQSIYASTLLSDVKEENIIYREFEVSEDENKEFYNNLEENINVDNVEYRKENFVVSGGKEQDTIQVSDVKEIVTKSNSIDEILNNLPRSLEYSKDGYIGETNLNIESIEVNDIYNGYYEEYIEDTKQYFDLNKNDMDYIPKEITRDGIKLYLVKVDWYPQTTRKTGDIDISDLYRGEAYYKGVKRIDNPLTYRVIAKYDGTATKEIDKPYIYTVKYKKVIKEKQNIVVPVTIGTTSGIFVIVILFVLNNKKVKVYGLKYGKYDYLGKLKINKSVIDLSKLKQKQYSNRYKFELNKSTFKKYKNKDITIKNHNVEKIYNVNKEIFEVNM